MAQYPRIRDQHIAVFGESGSGKTVLLSSFYGSTQEGSYSNPLWDLSADDAGQGNRLYQSFLGMRDRATVPPPTRFASTTYSFSVKLKGDRQATAKKPFDGLRLVWHDYPGEWFEDTPSSTEEEIRRVDTFRSLLRSDVALLLVDGQKLLEYGGEEERYLKSLLTNFRQGMLRIKDDLLTEEGRLLEFPRIWILALSKADLFPEWDVDTFRDIVIGNAAQHVEALRSTLQELIESPQALSIGEDFMLLSSAKFELSAGSEPVKIDVSERVGVDLILPLASILPLKRRVHWTARMDIPMKVLDTLADGAERLAAALTVDRVAMIDKAVSKVPKVGPVARIALPLLIKAAGLTGPKLKEANEQARAQHDYLTATLTQFKLDLEQGVENKLIRSPR